MVDGHLTGLPIWYGATQERRIRALGLVVQAAGTVEFGLVRDLAVLMQIDTDLALTVVAGEPNRFLFDRLKAVALLQHGDSAQDYIEDLKRVERAFQDRNKVIHATWAWGGGPDFERVKWKRGDTSPGTGERWTAERIEGVADELTRSYVELQRKHGWVIWGPDAPSIEWPGEAEPSA